MNKLKHNIIYNFLYQFIVLCFPLIVAPYLSRTIGAEGIGIYSYYYSIGYYFVLFAALGLSNYGTKTISANSSKGIDTLSKTFFEIYTVQFYTSLIAILMYIICIFVFKTFLYSIIFLPFVISSMFDITWFFFGIEEFKLVLLRNVIIKVLTTILIFICIHSNNDTYIYCIIMSASLLLSQISLWFKLKDNIKFKKVSVKESFKNHFSGNLKLFIPVLAVSIYKYMDKIMLGNMTSISELGFYENVEKIVNIPVAFVTALGTVMLSRITNLFSNGQEKKTKEYIKISIVFTVFLSSAMIFGILGISKEFIPLYFGNEFNPCIKLAYFMVPTVIFLGLSNVIRTQYLIPLNKEKIYIKSVCYGAIINFILNLILIPTKASYGAALATLIAELSVFAYQFMKTYKDINVNREFFKSFGFIIIGLIMYIIIVKINLNNNIYGLLLKILIGVLIYIILAIIYSFISLREYIKFRNIKKEIS